MIKKYRLLMIGLLITALVIGLVVQNVIAKDESKNIEQLMEHPSGITGVSNTPNIYMQVIGVSENQWILRDPEIPKSYVTIPITVEMWNSALKPLKNARVHVLVGKYIPSTQKYKKIYDQTKITDSNGRTKFGLSLKDQENNQVYEG